MAEFDFREWARNQRSGGSQSQSYPNPYAASSQFSWQDFANNYSQIANANRQMQQQRNNLTSQSEPTVKKYRQMTDLEKIAAGARVASDYISNFAGNALFGEPEEGEDVSEISLKNAPRMLANIPGMFLSTIPDAFAFGSELLSNTPTQTADLETGLIEDRSLTPQEKLGDLGYLGLTALSFTPLGVEGKALGLGSRALGKAAGAESKFGKNLITAGNIAYKGDKAGLGPVETLARRQGKKLDELNKARWADAALGTAASAGFESFQEAGQTLFEDMRYDQLDENTLTRMGRGAFWGGLAGGIVGGVMHGVPTAIENSRAKRGIDKTTKQMLATSDDLEKGLDWYDWAANLYQTPRDSMVTPEAYEEMQKQISEQKGLDVNGATVKGVPGGLEQKANRAWVPVTMVRNMYKRNFSDKDKISAMASDFLMTPKEFNSLMENPDNEAVASVLTEKVQQKKEMSPDEWLVVSTVRYPYAMKRSHSTFFVDGFTAGNTAQFGRGITELSGGDLDGDMWSIYSDKSLASWAHLPTRSLVSTKVSVDERNDGKAYTKYGKTDFGWEDAGVTDKIVDKRFEKTRKKLNGELLLILSRHGIVDNLEEDGIIRNIFDSFSVSEEESKAGITWQMKLANTLNKLRVRYSSEENRLAGDFLVEDLLQAIEERCSEVNEIYRSAEGYGIWEGDTEVSLEVQSLLDSMPEIGEEVDGFSSDNIPKGKGDLKGRLALPQIRSLLGGLVQALAAGENPTLRQSQLVYWNTKVVSITDDLIKELRLRSGDYASDSIRWCMQLIGALDHPIDYINALFVAKCYSDISTKLGINKTGEARKLGDRLSFKEFREAVTSVWNENAKLFDESTRHQLVTNRNAFEASLFKKVTVKDDQPNSFGLAVLSIFGPWNASRIGEIVSDPADPAYSLSLKALAALKADPNFGYYSGDYVYNEEFQKLLNVLKATVQAEENARISKIVQSINLIKDAPIDIQYDKAGNVIGWGKNDDAAMEFLVRGHQANLSIETALMFGIAGPKYLVNTGWKNFLITKDPEKVKRGYVAIGVTRHWLPFLYRSTNEGFSAIDRAYALSFVDFSNPVNRWIYARMLASEANGGRFIDPLVEITNPNSGTYEKIASLFDRNTVPGAHVKPNKDMLLYYALQSPVSSLVGSDLSTRAAASKEFFDAIGNNSFSKAVQHKEEVRELPSLLNIEPEECARALTSLMRAVPDTLNETVYAVALYDSQFPTSSAANKGSSNNSSSFHYSSLTDIYGAFSASFLKQLGTSIGQISASDISRIHKALRTALVDPSRSFDVQINSSAKYITISRERMFAAVNEKVRPGDTPTWNQWMKLFDAAPQLLLSIVPHTYEPSSVDANVMTLVVKQNPAKAIREYIEKSTDPATNLEYFQKINVDKVKSKMMADQDNPYLVFGAIDQDYGSVIADPGKFVDVVENVSGKWAKAIYDLSRIQDPYLRKELVERHFAGRWQTALDARKQQLEQIAAEQAQRAERASMRVLNEARAEHWKLASAEKFIDDFIEARTNGSLSTEDENGFEFEEARFEETENRILDDAEWYASYREKLLKMRIDLKALGSTWNFEKNAFRTISPIRPYELDFLRAKLEQVGRTQYTNEEGESLSFHFSEQEIDRIMEAVERKISQANLELIPSLDVNGMISEQELITDPNVREKNARSFIDKVTKFWEGRKYRRMPSDYEISWEHGFNGSVEEWSNKVEASFSWTQALDEKGKGKTNKSGVPINEYDMTEDEAHAWLHDQAVHWNEEIFFWAEFDAANGVEAITGNSLASLRAARDFIYRMIDETQKDPTISTEGTANASSIELPEISFLNPESSFAIDRASVELEKSGSSILASQNAGAYQDFAILDLIQEDFSCPAPLRSFPEKETARDNALSLLENETEDYIAAIDSSGKKRYYTRNDLLLKLSDEELAKTQFAPRADCLFGLCCHNHGARPIAGTRTGDFISGRHSLAELGWTLSEKRTFKAVKFRHVFDKIIRVVEENNKIKKWELPSTCVRQDWLKSIMEYQEEVTKHILGVFRAENLQNDFAIEEARIFAQFMTPAIEVTFTDQNGQIRTDTISKWSLASDKAFARELSSKNPALVILPEKVLSARPIAMSIESVCRKLTYDISEKIDSFRKESGSEEEISRETLSTYAHQAMETWRGKTGSDEDLLTFLKGIPVLKKASNRSMRFASSPNAMQNFLVTSGLVNRDSDHSRGAIKSQAPNSTFSKEDLTAVERFNDSIYTEFKAQGDKFSLCKPLIVRAYVNELSGKNTGDVVKRYADRFSRLGAVSPSFADTSLKTLNIAIVPVVDATARAEDVKKIWEKEKQTGRCLAIKNGETLRFFESKLKNSGVSDEDLLRASAGEIVIANKGWEKESYTLYRPFDEFTEDQSGEEMLSFIDGFSPYEVVVSIAGWGRFNLDNSGTIFGPSLSNRVIPIEETRQEYSLEVLLGNLPKTVNPSLASFGSVDLNEKLPTGQTLRDALKQEAQNRLTNGAVFGTGPTKIILPKLKDYDEGFLMQKVLDYLERPSNELSRDNGTVLGSVRSDECINIVAVKGNGNDIFYAPIIMHVSGAPCTFDRVYLEDSLFPLGQVAVSFDASLTLAQAEGLKTIFPKVPYKSYGRQATAEELAKWLTLGRKVNFFNPVAKQMESLTVDEFYSGEAEHKRVSSTGGLINAKLETLSTLSFLIARDYFAQFKVDGKISVEKLKEAGISTLPENVEMIERMQDPSQIDPWVDYVNRRNARISADEEIDELFKKVVRSFLGKIDHGWASPLTIFSTIRGNQQEQLQTLIRFNEQHIYGGLEDDQIDRFFHALCPYLCLDGNKETISDRAEKNDLPLVNAKGQILLSDGRYHDGHIHFRGYAKDSSMLGNPSLKAKWGLQGRINEAMVEGVRRDGDLSRLLDYAKVKNRDPRQFFIGYKDSFAKNPWIDPVTKESITDEKKQKRTGYFNPDDIIDKEFITSPDYRSHEQVEARRQKLKNQWDEEQSSLLQFRDEKDKGKTADMSSGSTTSIQYNDAMKKFRDTFDSVKWSDLEIHNMYRQTTGTTWNNGNGQSHPPVAAFTKWVSDVVTRVNRGKFAFESGIMSNGRVALGVVARPLLLRLMLNEKFRTFDGHEWSLDAIEDMMYERTQKSFELVEQLRAKDAAKVEAWYTNCDFVWGTYGKRNASRTLGDSGVHLSEMIASTDPVYAKFEEIEEYPHLQDLKQKTHNMISHQIEKEAMRNTRRVPTESNEAGFIARKINKGRGYWMDQLAAISRMMSVALPELPISSVIQRALVQGQNKIYMAIDENLTHGILSDSIGGIKIKNEAAVNAFASDPLVQKLWQAIFILAFKGENLLTLQKAHSINELDQIIQDRMDNMSWAEKAQMRMFRFSSGGRKGMSWQLSNWVHRLAMKFNEDNAPDLCKVEGPDGATRFERMLIENPVGFIFDFLYARDDNAYYIPSAQARNWIVDREHNGESFFGMVMTNFFEKHPFGKMLTITGLSRFPHYAYNTGGWFINHFAPISTFAAIARKAIISKAQNGKGKFADYLRNEIGTERLETLDRMSVKEALVNDAIMMGSTHLAALLFALGAIDPPDDEYYDEYAGNPAEWTIAGFRIGENWWIMDILGPFGAIACTWKSIQIGKPRFDLIENWMTQALWSNPMVRASDIVKTLVDPTEQYMEEYNQVQETYADAEGGVPSMSEMFLDDTISYGLNWVGQFVTPAFLKEIYQSKESQQYERSYRKVKNSEGELVETDYLDARIRKLTRSNPSLALLMNGVQALFGNPNVQSGYFARQMPRVEIPDQNQISSMQYYSLYNEDGSEKTEAEKQYVAFQVISVLSANNDMNRLWQEGFVIPMETRIYVSQMLNDWRQSETDEYNDWVQATGTNAYIVGDGDFTAGMTRISQIKEAYYDDLRMINGLYDKLWSEEMNRGLQMYYRKPTTYAKTTSGEYYATGYARSASPLQIIMPFITAPGTEDAWFGVGTNNEGTLGRAGNWETESAVIPGASAGGRNLVPKDPDKIKKPSLEDFASKENNGYSATEAGKALAAARSTNSSSTSTTPTSYPRSSGGSGGGGGGGYRSSAGGFYAPSVSLPRANSSRIMNTDRAIRPNYDYLRPDFETKGSREAYRRSDI